MSGKNFGVSTLFKNINSAMLYTHRHGQALNLVMKHAWYKVDIMKETFKVILETVKLVKGSLQQETKLKNLRAKSDNKAICPIRWTVRGETLNSAI